MGASVLASSAVYSARRGDGDDSFGHHPVSFVVSQVPRAYPLRQETGIMTGRVEPARTIASQAYPLSLYYPPPRRERSADKYPRSTPFALHSQP